ncbi:chemotaxis protein CheW [Lysobacter sp. LF1]|uniref:Chemotaxis protein CheW n=1 Tax=Lysobacter stagni TaxID=3045172 RepID=A0ABT6XBB5_9GAMM|nr:chemotaxis protein CheW [Lysobacter sp. LF1]MDI9237432.1 chemotaxis protein CheW [Lysobacter sp. LF1]
MTQPAIDAYLDELLDLHVDAVAPAVEVPSVPPAPVAAPVPFEIPAGLLDELDTDPLFAAVSSEPQATAPAPMIDAALLAELDCDPLFVAASHEPPAAAPMIDTALLAELESDPLFAAASIPSQPAASTPMIDDALLAELDSDPLFVAAASPPPAPAIREAAVVPAPAPKPAAPAPAPAPMAPIARPAPSTGLRPVEFMPPALMPSVTTTHRWLRVAVGEDSYAIELLRVQEVGRTSPIVAMRGAVPSVLGAMNLRGRIVPVFDLGLWLGTGRVNPDERARIVVVERDNELIGALVSAVDDVVTLGPDRIEPPLMASPSRAIVGVARVVAKPTVLLDANALFG